MDMIPYLRRLFEYDHWANLEVITALRAATSLPPRSVKLLAHIVAAEWLWYTRLHDEKQRLPVWPEMSLEQCSAEFPKLEEAWRGYLDGRLPAHLSRGIRYVNSKGESWTNDVQDVLLHVVMHSAYHRGQIASDMRASGCTPAYTDFIQAVRSGAVR
jgi:uncharacterized damage-inducible protein DinB